ncbi:hypothetical protein ABGB07_03730 [Micromonosporaceae bacterium B7E4]
MAGGDGQEPCLTATLVTAAGYAVGEVLTFLDGGTPETVGGAVEVTGAGRLRRRTWPPHPACDCTSRRRRTPPRRTPDPSEAAPDSPDPGPVG